MRKLIIHEFISLDGVIQAPGGAEEDTDGGFQHGGWTIPYWHDEIGARFFEAMSNVDAFLLGRKTWEIHGSAFDPMEGDPFADTLNAVQKYVVSTTLESPSLWRNSTIISDNVVESIRQLKEQDGKDIFLDGSSVLAHTLAENDLVDEYRLHVYPLVLGNGKRLFPEDKRIPLRLLESKALPTGVIYQQYEPDR